MSDIFLQAKKVNLFHYMDSIGIKPVRKNSRKAYYLSPKRSESNPSFELDLLKNTWSDRGEPGAFGDPTDFVEWLDGCTKKEAAEKLIGEDGIPQYHKPPPEAIEERLIDVVSVKDEITEPYLVDYLELQRKIPVEVANKYCKEVLFQFSTSRAVKHYGIGQLNDKGGWNLRSAWFKGSTKPAGISTVNFVNSTELYLFEGWTDYLSYVILKGEPKHTSICLNSLVFIPMMMDVLIGYDNVHSYLDLDAAADRMMEEMADNKVTVTDHRDEFDGYKDMNEFLCATIDI
jgi:hypothetical protein